MATRLSTGLVSKLAVTSNLRTIFTACFLDIYSGVQPTSADDVPNGIKLVTIYNNGVSTGLNWEAAALTGVLLKLASETWSGTVLATGTAGWFRLREAGDAGTSSSTTAARVDGGIASSGAQMDLANLSLTIGAPFVLPSGQITLPKGT
jgi:hypothetical protein